MSMTVAFSYLVRLSEPLSRAFDESSSILHRASSDPELDINEFSALVHSVEDMFGGLEVDCSSFHRTPLK